MSKTLEDSPTPERKLDLMDLLPVKESVVTSLGVLYVRHVHVYDWKHFESNDLAKLGTIAVRKLVSRVEDKRDSGPLAEEDFGNLNDSDFNALAQAIATRSGWSKLPIATAYQDLGQAVLSAKERERERHKKTLDELRKSISGSYAFMEKSALEKLQDQVAGLASVRDASTHSDAMKKALGIAGSSYDPVRPELADTHVPRELIRSLERATNSQQVSAEVADSLKSRLGVGELEGAISSAGSSIERLLRESKGNHVFEDRMREVIKPIETPRIHMPLRPENTPLGRATIESAENSRLVAQSVDGLVSVVAGINQTLVAEVLPSWFKQVERQQKGAKESFDQAAKGLWWTKWAVIASIVVTVLATWWQVSVARDIDRENSVQQTKALDILREQLAVQQRAIDQQALESGKLRELFGSKSQPTGTKK